MERFIFKKLNVSNNQFYSFNINENSKKLAKKSWKLNSQKWSKFQKSAKLEKKRVKK